MSVDRSSRTHSPLTGWPTRAKPESFFPDSICTPKQVRNTTGEPPTALISAPPPPGISLYPGFLLRTRRLRRSLDLPRLGPIVLLPLLPQLPLVPRLLLGRLGIEGANKLSLSDSIPPAPAPPLSWRPFPPTPSAAPPRAPSVAPSAVPPPLAALRPPGLSSAPTGSGADSQGDWR